ncbi:MAG TPA: DNA polymerase III subunit delta' C-terminal domain-containing protein [Chloroflexia bacterium]|nr:DNA polymerase III subunit delta' C-terminal domain-containing protein [Chloroflexia bacterium]
MTSAVTAPSWPVIGQPAAVALLQQAATTGHPAHAYLLAGPPQVGKATLARVFAQALLCQGDPAALDGPAVVPCGRCAACRRIARGTYPDVDWYSLARQAAEPEQQGRVNKDLSIATIRAILNSLSLRPYEGRWRVVVLEDADALSLAAANALLKTLEEPPPYAVLVLLAADPGSLPQTIVSRVQLVPLRPAGRAAVAEALRAQGIAEPDVTLLAALSGGRIGWALETAAHPERLAERAALLDVLAALPTADLPARFAFAAELAARFSTDRAGVYDTLVQLALWWRDLLVVRAGCPNLVHNADRIAALQAAAPPFSLAQLRAFLAALAATQEQLEQNVSPRLALESLLLAMPGG